MFVIEWKPVVEFHVFPVTLKYRSWHPSTDTGAKFLGTLFKYAPTAIQNTSTRPEKKPDTAPWKQNKTVKPEIHHGYLNIITWIKDCLQLFTFTFG